MADVKIPYADPGRASFEEMDTYVQSFLLAGTHPELAPAHPFPLRNNTSFKQFSVVGLDADGYLAMATQGAHDGVAATGVLTFSGAGTASDTITIGERVYTLVAADPEEDEVLIGASAAATALNLIAAINGDDTARGVTYGEETAVHEDVLARSDGSGVVGLVAKVPGTAGNAIATTETSTSASFGGATLSGGLDPAGVRAAYVIAHACSLGNTGTGNGLGFYSGCFNQDALVWDESFATDEQKQNAFFGAPTPTNIVVRKRGEA